MKKIIVNPEACIGCGACVSIDPEHFAFNDEGLSHAISEENLESQTSMSAIDSCPTSAISIKEVDGEDNTEYASDEASMCDGCSCCAGKDCECEEDN